MKCQAPYVTKKVPGPHSEMHSGQNLPVVFVLEVKEVDSSEHKYVLVPTLSLTLNKMLRDGQRLPKASFLVVILRLIIGHEDCAPKEEV
nr:unnamed protein product [Rangifer tarandus platyrhynchus]